MPNERLTGRLNYCSFGKLKWVEFRFFFSNVFRDSASGNIEILRKTKLSISFGTSN